MSAPTSPYVGLVPYTKDDEPYFFGRDQERKTIAFNLRGARLTLLYGPAGVGKTSILNAGVLHDLDELASENFKKRGRPELIALVFSAWRNDPMRNLVAEIARAASPYIDDNSSRHYETLTLSEAAENWSQRLKSDVLIMLDQFEEFFLYNTGTNFNTFADRLAEAVNNSRLSANFLISIREDALSKLDVFKGLIPNLFENYLRVEHLRTTAVHEAIVGPVEIFNRDTAADPPYVVQEQLISEVAKQIAVGQTFIQQEREHFGTERVIPQNAPAKDQPIEAPLLQMVMKRVWNEEQRKHSRKLRLATYISLGHTTGIVKSHLDVEMNKLSDSDKETAADIFYYLVTPTGWKIAHTAKDLAGYVNEAEPVLEEMLEHLASVRILRISPSPAGDVKRFEIFHEVLAPAVLEWWSRIKLDRETAEERLRLEKEKVAIQRKAEIRRMQSRLFATIYLTVALFLLLIAVAFGVLFAVTNRLKQQADRAEQIAVERYDEIVSMDKEWPYIHAVLRGHTAPIVKAIFSPAQNQIATVSNDRTARLWDTNSGRETNSIELSTPSTDIIFASEGLLAIASGNQILLWNGVDKKTQILGVHEHELTKLSLQPGPHRWLASGDVKGVICIWDMAEKRQLQCFAAHQGAINDIEWNSQDVAMLASASNDKTARIWTLAPPKTVTVPHKGAVNSAVFSPDGKELLTASDDYNARVSHVSDGSLIRYLGPHAGNVNAAQISEDRIITASGNGSVTIWPSNSSSPLAPLEIFTGEGRGVAFSNDGQKVIAWGQDPVVRVLDANQGTVRYELRGHIKPVSYASFSPDGNLAVTSSADYTARVWDVAAAALELDDPTISIEGCNPVRVFGRITVKGVAGVVRYRFIVNGRTRVDKPLEFDGPGTKEVGALFAQSKGTVTIQITSAKSTKSKTISIGAKCGTTAEPAAETSSPLPTPSPSTSLTPQP